MRRRAFIAGVGGIMVAWPLAVRAQQKPKPVIGFLNGFAAADWSAPVAAFHKGLAEAGFVEARNVAIEYRWAEGRYDRIPALAADLVRRKVDVLVATGGGGVAFAAKAATATIPIVFVLGSDPVRQGLVASLARPGGNVTGVAFLTTELEGKRLGLLRELVAHATLIAVLLNPTMSAHASVMQDIAARAGSVGQRVHILTASSDAEIERAFAAIAEVRAAALLVGNDPFFRTRRDTIVALAARYAIPTIYEARDYAVAGGLVSYGTDLADATRLAGDYTARILKGAKPADLAVQQPTRFQMVINLKTAKTLGLAVPPLVLAQADEVIE